MIGHWQPIETAPQDIEILGSDGSVVEIYRWDPQKYHKKPRPFWTIPWAPAGWARMHQPIKWMPKPAPCEKVPV